MQAYSEVLPPTGVTSSIHLDFTGPGAANLVVAKTSLLQVYRVATAGSVGQAKLILLAEYALQGTISALAKVNPITSKAGGDALLIAFRDAKLSLIEWDPSQYSISTISIHYYENHEVLLCPWSPDIKDCPTRLTVDPSSRCAAFNFNGSSLAIIPFHQSGDDLAMDDDDESDGAGEEKLIGSPSKQADTANQHEDKLYAPSFVLPLTALDPNLLHPIAMTFLHEYREPTIGVLFATYAASMNMTPTRRDTVMYAVYTLDIEQKASTTLLSVTKLPNDLHQIVAMPAPVGGSLLLGGNEVIHIDQSGRMNALGVNQFSKRFSSFPMTDQSNLELRLEDCKIQPLGTSMNEVILILNDGQFVILSFRMDGRSVSELYLEKLDRSLTAGLLHSRCSSITTLPQGYVFLGSDQADSILISTTKKISQLKKISSRAYLDDTVGDIEMEEDDDDDDDDDLYADDRANGNAQQNVFDASFLAVSDTICSLAPIQDLTIGRQPRKNLDEDEETDSDSVDSDRLELAMACNGGSKGSVAFLSRYLQPTIVKRHSNMSGDMVWALSSEMSELDADARPFDDVLVLSSAEFSGSCRSSLLSLSKTIVEKQATDFEQGQKVIATGRLKTGSHVVVYTRDIRAYNQDFGLDQIFAIVDEENDDVAEVVAATVTETHILVLKSDRTITLLRVDKGGDLDEVDIPDSIPSEDVLSACIYDDQHDFFDTQRLNSSKITSKGLILVVLTEEGVLSLHPISNLKIQVFQYHGLQFVPTGLSADFPVPKHWRNQDQLAEMSLCDLGSTACSKPYLILRNTSSDITIYEPFSVPGIAGSFKFIKQACFNADPRMSYNNKGEEDPPLKSTLSFVPLHDVNGSSVLILTGKYPALVCKPTAGMPVVHKLGTGPITHVSGFHDSSCNRGLVYVGPERDLVFCELPVDAILDFPKWVIRKIEIGENVTNLTYHPRTGSYILAASVAAPFNLPRDDEWHPEWAEEHEKASPQFLPTSQAVSLKLISSSTHSIISEYRFSPDEQVLSVKCLSLEVSEQTHERKDLVVVGTGIMKGENVVTRGFLYLFDIVDVVPQPEIPETDLKLKLVAKEEVRGAVTAISSIGSQGFILAAQGQKCMVRGLREDNAILPVAFMDMKYYVSVAKELAGTGLTILADTFAGLWLTGYSEEPYKMQLLGRDLENPSVVAADFMPQDKQLYIIASDGQGELRVLQYDPWNPKTERGSILLHRSTFNTGYFPTLMTLLPRSPTPSEALIAATSRPGNESDSEDEMQVEPAALPVTHQILIVTREGALTLITPLSEAAYRRLSTLQTTLMTQLEQLCGLNPRAYRQVETDGVGGRAMVDGQVIKRWLMQSSQHKYGLADRVGGTLWDMRADMEIIEGAGLGYL